MIFFRADGNGQIGMGHVMRCMSIAKACKTKGEKILFITATKESVAVIENNGYEVELLSTDYKEMESEIPYIKQIICNKKDKESTVILIDSYNMTNSYVEKMKEFGKVCCMDDLGNAYPCDMLINYNIYAPQIEYDYPDIKPIMLIGAEYAPVREEFCQDCNFEVREEAKNIMITTGGSDPKNATTGLLNTFLKNGMLNRKNVVYHVVIGPLNPFKEELKKQFGNEKQVILYENIKNMKELMEQCDVLITATGSTVYEACAVGIPMICFYYVENQQGIADYFDKNTDVINCGDYSLMPQMVCYNANDALARCVIGKSTRYELYEQERKIVSGKGAENIATKIISL